MGDSAASRQTSGAYEYLPLNESAGEIRLLHLLPGHFTSPIRVVLESTPFSPDAPPDFEALSYTWGSPENPIDIFVGASGCYTLAVTQNLAEALPYLRLEDRARTLWIDAICVNQGDMVERTSQVKRMADIYSKATRVVVWLGPASDDSSMAIDIFNTICSNIVVDWQTYTFQPTSPDSPWADGNMPIPLDQAQSNSISSLLSRSWFERLWIWQEVKLPPGDTIVKCGYQTITWSSMCHAVYYLQRMNSSQAHHDLLKSRVDPVLQLCDRRSSGHRPFTFLLYETKYSKCSDPRDRVFALLSLLYPSERIPGIQADYSKPVSEVYKNTVLCILRFHRTLKILATAGLEQGNLKLPSWVPNWPRESIDVTLDYSVLCSGEALATNIGQQADDDILQVTGVSIATIDRVESFRLPEYNSTATTDIAHEIIRIASWLNLQAPFEEHNQDFVAFCRTICADDFSEQFYPQRADRLSLKGCLQDLCFVLGLQGNMDSWNRRFLKLVQHYICGRAFFITKDGRMGLGPKGTKPGDIVTVLLGGATAFALRPADDVQHQLVGEAYCHGFMDAEALLGPLPEKFQFLAKFEEKSNVYWWGHMDRETELFYCEDPRLGELPSGWKRKNHPSDQYWNWFVNETGEEMKGRGDPRLTPEVLKQRGVDLKVFELV
jgi:hypothetical protein